MEDLKLIATSNRDINDEHLSRLFQIASQLKDYSLEDLKSTLKNNGITYELALEGKTIGICTLYGNTNLLNLVNFCIAEKYQNDGFGKYFLEWILFEEKDLRIGKLISLVCSKELQNFYERFGFKTVMKCDSTSYIMNLKINENSCTK